MALATDLSVRLAATLTNPLDLSTPADALVKAVTLALTSGTGASQANMMWHDQRTLSASATENLDLAGSLTNAFGTTQTFARIKLVLVSAAAANTNNVNVIREGTNGVPLFLALGDGIPVRPGGVFLWAATDSTSVAVTAGTGDLLTVTNSAGSTSVTYDIIIIGASA
jgi:hypothetical protein